MQSTVSTLRSPVDASAPSATEWIAALGRGELSARELAEYYLQRIFECDERLNAVVALEPELTLAQADEADRARRGGASGALLGLPVTIKDSIDVVGLPCTGGSLARAGFMPTEDATVVKRLRDAGAVILAKTNVPEYSSAYETDNVLHGRTNHPLDPSRTPGGSSGGEAALAGADATPLGIGTDGGGSLRVPGHYCGVIGLRPTVGRVPDTGTWPQTRATGYGDLFCVGPIARFAEDAALVLPVISGPDGLDPYAVPAPLGDPRDVSLTGLRVGVFADDPRLSVSCGTLAALARAAGKLSDAGADVFEVQAPWDEDPTTLFFDCVAADGGAQVRADLVAAGGRHHPLMAGLLKAVRARTPTAADWFDVAARVHLIALGGLPAASVPIGHEDGLPIGVQVAARPYREDVVLAVAAALEATAS